MHRHGHLHAVVHEPLDGGIGRRAVDIYRVDPLPAYIIRRVLQRGHHGDTAYLLGRVALVEHRAYDPVAFRIAFQQLPEHLPGSVRRQHGQHGPLMSVVGGKLSDSLFPDQSGDEPEEEMEYHRQEQDDTGIGDAGLRCENKNGDKSEYRQGMPDGRAQLLIVIPAHDIVHAVERDDHKHIAYSQHRGKVAVKRDSVRYDAQPDIACQHERQLQDDLVENDKIQVL